MMNMLPRLPSMKEAAAAAVLPENMNAIIVELNFRIKQQLIGICYFAVHWRIYDVAAAAAAARAQPQRWLRVCQRMN
jgi:hypothetical protein